MFKELFERVTFQDKIKSLLGDIPDTHIENKKDSSGVDIIELWIDDTKNNKSDIKNIHKQVQKIMKIMPNEIEYDGVRIAIYRTNNDKI